MGATYSFSWICHVALRSSVAGLAAPCSPVSEMGHAQWLGAIEWGYGLQWAYASSLNIPCPQHIAPLRAAILMASQADFPDITPTIQSTPLSYPITANTAQKKSLRSDHFTARYVPILMAGGPGLKIYLRHCDEGCGALGR